MGHPVYGVADTHVGENERVFHGQIRDSDDPIVKRFPDLFSDDYRTSPYAVVPEEPRKPPVVEEATAVPGEPRPTTRRARGKE